MPEQSNAPPPPDPGGRTYQLFDVDDEEALFFALDDDERSSNPSGSRTAAIQPSTLPSGQVIDAKNKLQSVLRASGTASTPVSSTAMQREPPPLAEIPTLPNGEVITAKNTMRSFENEGIQASASSQPASNDRPGSHKGSRYIGAPVAVTTSTAASAVAIEVDPDIVYAELALEPVPSLNVAALDSGTGNYNGGSPPISPLPWFKSKSTWLIIFALVLAVVLGLFIGTTVRDNGSNPKVPIGTTSPIPATAGPIATTSSPTIMLIASPSTENPSANPTLQMTPAPSLTPVRTQILTSYINNITLSNQTLNAQGAIPESKALAWMIANDTSLNTTALAMAAGSADGRLSASTIGFKIRQRYALLTMWFQQSETLKWAQTDNWLTQANECDWYGISCNVINDAGLIVNAVISVRFNGTRSYVGYIPADVGLLSNMQIFQITNTYDLTSSNAYVFGTIPDSLGKWTDLIFFDVRSNFALTGPLPNSITQWTALEVFDVSYNALTGPLPDNIDKWSALRYFSARDTALSGTLPDGIGQWTALSNFDVNNNVLNGSLPESIGQWTALTYFDVCCNDLTGTLPDSFGNWTALTSFAVYENSLIGSLPNSIGQGTALTYFNIYRNLFTGTIPISIGNWSLIEIADFAVNQLVGTVPNAICEYIDPDMDDFFRVDCTVNCTCCTTNCI